MPSTKYFYDLSLDGDRALPRKCNASGVIHLNVFQLGVVKIHVKLAHNLCDGVVQHSISQTAEVKH